MPNVGFADTEDVSPEMLAADVEST